VIGHRAGNHQHTGVSFTVNGVTKQTDANGQACFDGLAFGDYMETYAWYTTCNSFRFSPSCIKQSAAMTQVL
jgi:hypothetical protein